MKNCIVCDCDGTILNTEFIHKEVMALDLKGDDKWDYFNKKCCSSEVDLLHSIKDLLIVLNHAGVEIVICTARNESGKYALLHKLIQEGIPNLTLDHIYMRKADDLRVDSEVKEDLLSEIQKKYNVLAFIDDSLSCCETAKKLGIMALRRV